MPPISNTDIQEGGRSVRQEPRGRRLRVLLVDDDPVDVKYLRLLSNDMRGFRPEFVVADQPERVADLLKEGPVDLALVDFWLGSVSAVDIIEELAARRSIPTVVLTGLDVIDIRESGYRAGALGFLSKHHLSAEALESVISSVLRLHAVERLRRFERFDHDDMAASLEGWLTSIQARLHAIEHSLEPETTGLPDARGDRSAPAVETRRVRADISFLRREIGFGLPLLHDSASDPVPELSRFDLAEAVRDAAGEFVDDESADARAIVLDEVPAPVVIESDRTVVTDLLAYLIKATSDERRGRATIRIGVGAEDGDAFVVLSEGRRMTPSESSAWLKQAKQLGPTVDSGSGARGRHFQFAANTAVRLGGVLDVDGPEEGGSVMVVLPTRFRQGSSKTEPSAMN